MAGEILYALAFLVVLFAGLIAIGTYQQRGR